MYWAKEFIEPFTLKNGRRITTLAEARDLIRQLPEPEQNSRQWEYAAGLLWCAAEYAHARALVDVQRQFSKMLDAQGLT